MGRSIQVDRFLIGLKEDYYQHNRFFYNITLIMFRLALHVITHLKFFTFYRSHPILNLINNQSRLFIQILVSYCGVLLFFLLFLTFFLGDKILLIYRTIITYIDLLIVEYNISH